MYGGQTFVLQLSGLARQTPQQITEIPCPIGDEFRCIYVDQPRVSFPRLLDGLHTALWLYDVEGDRECRRFLESTGYLRDRDFRALVEAAVKGIPRSRRYERGQPVGFLLPEAEVLERMRITFFPDIEPPQEVQVEGG